MLISRRCPFLLLPVGGITTLYIRKVHSHTYSHIVSGDVARGLTGSKKSRPQAISAGPRTPRKFRSSEPDKIRSRSI